MKRILLFFFVLHYVSCVSEKEEGAVVMDQTLVNLAQNSTSFTYFRNSTDTLATDPSSDHGAFMRVRMNPRAVASMNDSVNNLNEALFPDESMIVKEMYNFKGGPLTGFVIMYKLRSGSDSNGGWLWGEYQSDGTPFYPVSKKGDRCIGCHQQSTNADLVRTFSLH